MTGKEPDNAFAKHGMQTLPWGFAIRIALLIADCLRCAGKNSHLIALLPACALLLSVPDLRAESVTEVVHVQQAQTIVSDLRMVPAADAGWKTVDLPHRVENAAAPELTSYWYRAQFTYVGNDHHVVWLYLPKLRSGGLIFINGTAVNHIHDSDARFLVQWFQPHLIAVPVALLGDGINEIAIRIASRDPIAGLGEVSIGAEQPLREMHERQMFRDSTIRTVATTLCLIVGSFAIVFWLRRRQEALHLLFGIGALLWCARSGLRFLPVVPMEYWVLWRGLLYFTTGGFIVCAILFLLKFSGYANRCLNRFLAALWLGGAAAFMGFGAPLQPTLDTYWFAAFAPFVLFALLVVTRFAWRQRSVASVSIAVAAALAIGLTVHDFLVQQGWFGLHEIYLLHIGIPAFLIAVLGAMLERFIASLEQAESSNERLAFLVDKRERELATNYEQLKKFELERAVTQERQRIMQDMHDGAGSSLFSALLMVRKDDAEQGIARDRTHVAALLQESLDEMRMAIDALSPGEPDLLPALSTFRHRTAPRLKRAGLEFVWRNENLPDAVDVEPHTGLHILRILQEATTNVLKHACAKKVTVTVIRAEDILEIRVEDDGVGIDSDANPGGHGLRNMKKRAETIGAVLSVIPLARGSLVSLMLPIRPA
jgi:signal transduction histidine kinase